MNNKKLACIIRENIKEYLIENRESKNINLARKYLKNKSYSDTDAQRILDNIRTSIPNSRLGQCKFLLGVVRLYLNNELNNGRNVNNLNKLLQYIASEAHINEYDNNLNNLSLQEIINRFDSVRRQDYELSRKNSYSKQFTKNENYNIVKIPDFKTASQYSGYTSWCVTYDEKMYDNYTNDGVGLFYFCLKKGFENVPKEQGENCPLDEYGLSMIAVSVDENGEPNTITCRWNHDMEGNDHIMTKDELEDLLGVNFYEVFKPYTEEELKAKGHITPQEAVELLKQGNSPSDVFPKVFLLDNDNFVKVLLNKKYSFVNIHNNRLIFDGKLWFNYVDNFREGFAVAQIDEKFTFLNTNCEIPTDKSGNMLFFNWVHYFHNGLALVENNDKFMFIDKNFNYIKDKNSGNILAFDYAEPDLEENRYMVFLDKYGDFLMDENFNFYDVETEEPIPSPLISTNESIYTFNQIITETITKYLQNNLLR